MFNSTYGIAQHTLPTATFAANTVIITIAAVTVIGFLQQR
jgi:hypothetical protein